ncbi:MAG: flagellar biosynthetic protein FliR [Betaproteobacteria bacterium]|nr:flagellar biosynthetic protein FliR [Betaproteobacteria bacterium]
MLSASSAQIELWIAAFLWPLLRILALFSSAPVLSDRSVPRRVRVGLALLVTVLIAPTLPAPAPLALFSGAALLLVAQQLLVGLAIGFSVRIAFSAVELAGDQIGLQMGLSYATFFDPQTSSQTPIVGSLLSLLATLVFLAIDGPALLLLAIAESFTIAPIGGTFAAWLNWGMLAQLGAQIFSLGLQLALPVLATLLACNLALGVMARAAPQLNLFSVGFPITLLAGLVLLALMVGYLGGPLEAAVRSGLRMWL